jgi:hypothetical protein
MHIRREDKEAIRCLAFIGAALGACLGPILVLNESRKARDQLSEQQQYLNNNASVLSLDDSPVTLDQLGLSTPAVGQVLEELQQKEAEIVQLEKGFWITLPLWALAGLGIAGCVCGVAIGYHLVWLISWLGSFALYKFIRTSYKLYWQIGSEDRADQSEYNPQTESTSRRNAKRIMPVIIKLILLMIIAIMVLGLILYQLTAIKVP